MRIQFFVLCSVVMLCSSPVWAGDGVLEINQTCAVNTGCFVGDAALFPVTIDGSAGTSVLLTSDLVVPDENTTGILIAADNVTVDLNGFTISGVTQCSGSPAVCAPIGTGVGVTVDLSLSPRPQRTTLLNGSVVGMGGNGIDLGSQSRIHGVLSNQNGVGGILARSGSIITMSGARSNGDTGIYSARGGVVSGCTSRLNGTRGIQIGGTGGGRVVTESSADSNGDIGILCDFACTLTSNVVKDNVSSGIATTADQAARISHNTVTGNAIGLNLAAGAAYDHNTVTANVTNQVSGGFDAGGNHCAGTGAVSPSCP
jgi:hypothetical protein